MAVNLSALAPLTSGVQALANLVVVSPQKTVGYQPQKTGTTSLVGAPPALLFHYEGEQSATFESDITDHYIEDNSAVQDQIALKPETVLVHGYIGELNNIAPYGLQTLKLAAEKLTGVAAYAPQVSTTAALAYAEAFQLYQTGANAVAAGVSLWNNLSGSGGENVIDEGGLGDSFDASTGTVRNSQSKQQTAFQQFYGYWKARTLFTVQTPWAVFQNMAIKSVRAVQDADSSVITDFEVTFKMVRTTTSAFASGAELQGNLKTQAAGVTDNGTSSPTADISSSSAQTAMGAP